MGHKLTKSIYHGQNCSVHESLLIRRLMKAVSFVNLIASYPGSVCIWSGHMLKQSPGPFIHSSEFNAADCTATESTLTDRSTNSFGAIFLIQESLQIRPLFFQVPPCPRLLAKQKIGTTRCSRSMIIPLAPNICLELTSWSPTSLHHGTKYTELVVSTFHYSEARGSKWEI